MEWTLTQSLRSPRTGNNRRIQIRISNRAEFMTADWQPRAGANRIKKVYEVTTL